MKRSELMGCDGRRYENTKQLFMGDKSDVENRRDRHTQNSAFSFCVVHPRCGISNGRTMNTINGSLDVRIVGDNVYIKVDDCDLPARATAELSTVNVKTLRATLEEALIRLDYPDQNKGLGNDTLEQP